MTFDVAVVGGGPAGSVCAARLAASGRSVVLLERDHHPRFHLGESLLPGGLDVLEAIGVLDAVSRTFMVKRGARFVDGADEGRASRYCFADAFKMRRDHAFQVPRDAFDELLFRNAGRCGADLREGWEATGTLEHGGAATGVRARAPDGSTHVLEARVVVDATGRDAMLARATGAVERIPHLDRVALYTQVHGAWRNEGEREGDIEIVLLELPGAGSTNAWMWLIPFADGRTSVGAVVSHAWVRARQERTPVELLDAVVAASPTASRMLVGAERLFAPRATGDFSFQVKRMRGDGWLAIGDAGGFIDPLFSTGAHLAMHGGLLAADAIDAALTAGDVSASRFAAWEATMQGAADLFLGVVQAFYEGELTPYLFATDQHPFLRRALTTLLAGDVFDSEARWTRELRARFPARR